MIDPTLPRLSNVKCINNKCLTNHSERQLVLLNSNNTKREELISYLSEIGEGEVVETSVTENDIVEYGEINTSVGNLPIKHETLLTNPVKLFKFMNSTCFYRAVNTLKKLSETENLLPQRFIKNIEDNPPILSEILREIISIKYDDINMKYMYICTTCGSSWKNIN